MGLLHQDQGDASACNNNNHSSGGLQLVLGLALTSTTLSPPSTNKADEPSLTLGLCGTSNTDNRRSSYTVPKTNNKMVPLYSSEETTSNNSPHSSFSTEGRPVVVVKRERDLISGGGGGDDQEVEEEEAAEIDSPASPNRKKLRLTKDQSALLEESFKQHSTLNPKQKQALARELNLRPRQVEVWFQNRRARTKLKQTEMDCEFLKKCCESLTDENRRLQKELQELKALKLPHPLYMPMPAATLSICPSCERLGGDGSGGGSSGATSNKISPFSFAPKAPFYAAC